MYALDIINTNGSGATLLHITSNNFALLVKEAEWYSNRPQTPVEASIIDNAKRQLAYSIISK